MKRNIIVSVLLGIVLIPLVWLYINDYLPIKYHKSAREVISLAHKEFDNGNYKKAINLWEQSLRLKPHHPGGIYHDIGMSYTILEKYDKAIEPLTKSIEIDKNNGSSYYNRGLAYYNLNKAEKAKEDFKKTIEINKPSHPDEIKHSYELLAHIEYLDRNYDKALFYINMYESLIPEGYIGSPSLKMSIISDGYSPSEANKYAISIEPKIQNFSIEDKANFYYDWGGILASEEKYVEAIEKLKKATEINKNHPYAYSEICQKYSELKDGKNAIKYCEIGIKVFPHPLVYDHACYAYYIDKQYESALKYCNLLIDNKYDIPNIYYHRALIYKELNKNEEAKNDLKKAKDLVNNWEEEKSLTEANYRLEKGDKELIKKIDDLLNKL